MRKTGLFLVGFTVTVPFNNKGYI